MPAILRHIYRCVVRIVTWTAILPAAAAAGGDNTHLGTAEQRALRAALESIQVSQLRQHASYLADDTFEGREAGRRGGRAAGVYIGQELRRLGLAGAGSGGGYYQPFGDGYRNVLALIEGSDEKLKQEVIVLSAHYDHVGYGSATNSLGPTGYIHNGADDNGSGTAGLLEVIEAFTQLEVRPKRTLLFAFWDAEEKRLLGSKHWITEPTFTLQRVRAMVNLDMIGRLRNRELLIYGARTAVGFRELITRDNQDLDLRLTFDWAIKANSDHHPFYARGIPFFMLHTGLHSDYHRPSDDADKLNVEGMQAASRLCFLLASDLANRPTLPAFRGSCRYETVETQRTLEQPAPPLPARLGVSWGNKPADGPGIRVVDVAPGSAAARDGVQAGDRVLRFDGREVRDDAGFQSWVLAADKPVTVTVQRNGEERPRELRIQLDGEPVRIGIAWRDDDAEPGSVALSRVVPASPAARVGLEVNDRIYAVAGQHFATSTDFHRLVTTGNGPLELELARDGVLRQVRLELPAVATSKEQGPKPAGPKPGR